MTVLLRAETGMIVFAVNCGNWQEGAVRMYKGAGFSGNGRRKIWKAAGWTAAAAGIAGVFVLAAVKVLAAPEDPAVEAQAALEQQTLEEECVSGNGISPEEVQKTPGVPLIVVDPGHGGMDEGCTSGDVLEKDINLEIALKLQARLSEMGYQAVLAREGDTYTAKEQRVEAANSIGADAYVSIHQNTFGSPDAGGIETWYDGADTSRDSKRLAQLIHRETIASTGAAARELKDDAEFCVTGRTAMPACLIETGFLSNPGEKELLTGTEYQEKLALGIAQGIELFFHPKTMYLTFDDGPSEESTSAVLDILKERNIKATFFVVGENVRKHPDVAKRIAAEGHTIGIHCDSHDYGQLYQNVDSYLEDFQRAYDTVYEVTGVRARLFRFPGGSVNAYDKKICGDIIEAMTEKGFIYYDWNASLEDAVGKSEPEELVASAQATTLGRRKVVMLAHDIVYNTSLCLDSLIDGFPEYQMEPLTPELEPIQFKIN